MLKKLRWEKILACLDDQQLVLFNDLIKQLQLSTTTLRRDLTKMEQQRLLKLVHGGVKLQKSYEIRIEEQLNEKIQHHAEEKYLIARHAVKKNLTKNVSLFGCWFINLSIN